MDCRLERVGTSNQSAARRPTNWLQPVKRAPKKAQLIYVEFDFSSTIFRFEEDTASPQNNTSQAKIDLLNQKGNRTKFGCLFVLVRFFFVGTTISLNQLRLLRLITPSEASMIAAKLLGSGTETALKDNTSPSKTDGSLKLN